MKHVCSTFLSWEHFLAQTAAINHFREAAMWDFRSDSPDCFPQSDLNRLDYCVPTLCLNDGTYPCLPATHMQCLYVKGIIMGVRLGP